MSKIQEIARLIIEINELHEEIEDKKKTANMLNSLVTGRDKKVFKVNWDDFQFESLDLEYLKAKKAELEKEEIEVRAVLKKYDHVDTDDYK